MVRLFVCSYSFLQWTENQLILRCFLRSSQFIFSTYPLFVFSLFFYFIGKGEHSLSLSHTYAHVMYSQMAQFPVYIQLWTLFFYNDRISMLPLWHLMLSIHITQLLADGNILGRWGETKRHNRKNRDTEQIKFVFSPCILCTMYFTCIMVTKFILVCILSMAETEVYTHFMNMNGNYGNWWFCSVHLKHFNSPKLSNLMHLYAKHNPIQNFIWTCWNCA